MEYISWNNCWVMQKNFNFLIRYNFKNFPQLYKKMNIYFRKLMKWKHKIEWHLSNQTSPNQTLVLGILKYLPAANIWIPLMSRAQFLLLGIIAVNKSKSTGSLVPVCLCKWTYADTPVLKRKHENDLLLCALFCNLPFFLLAIYFSLVLC